MNLRALTLPGLVVAVLWTSIPVGALAQATPTPSSARLQGTFAMRGRITAAKRIPGEHVGEHVHRTWTFVPQCAAGPCPTVELIRNRAGGTDTLVLHEAAPGLYTGKGSFYGPLRCGKHTVAQGELVPFRIRVQITAATISGGATVASALRATYRNHSRINLTRCVGVLGHDAAVYTGQLVSS